MTDQREARRRRRSRWAVAIALVAVLLSSCDAVAPSVVPTIPLPSDVAFETFASFEPLPTDEVPTEPPFTPDDTGSPGTPPCEAGALKASNGIMEVDADDRTTELLLVAADTCSVDAYPTLLLRDADGRVLVAADPAGVGGIDLVPGVAYTSEVRLSNWCLGEPAWPLSIGIVHAASTIPATGESFPDEGALPPCVYQDADPTLAGSAWAPSP